MNIKFYNNNITKKDIIEVNAAKRAPTNAWTHIQVPFIYLQRNDLIYHF